MPAAPISGPVGRTRWKICGLLGVGAFVNYVDRVNLSIAAPLLTRDFHISPETLGIVFSTFLWTYTLLQIPMGQLIDRIGIKWVLRVATMLWVVATLLTAVAGGLGLIIVARLLLGVAETPMVPAAWKATGYWFPKTERGMSTTIIDGAAKLSNVLGIPAIALVIHLLGWRAAFLVTAGVSLLYAIAFWMFYRDPRESLAQDGLSEAEYGYIIAGGAEAETEGRSDQRQHTVWTLLAQRKTWGLSIGYASYTYTFYMLLTWLPGYLTRQMGLNMVSSGLYTSIPWLAAVVAQFAIAGWWVDRRIKLGADSVRLRRGVLCVSMLIALAIVGTAFADTLPQALVFLAVSASGLAVSASTGQSIVALIAPEGCAAKLGGIVNFIANLVGLSAPIVTGYIVQATGSFTLAFVSAGIAIVIGIFGYTMVLGPIEQIRISQPSFSV